MLEIAIHDLTQARAALEAAEEAGVPVSLRSAPAAALYAGVGYLKALCDEVGHELVIDCGDDAGVVMAALREGCRRLIFSGSAEIAQKLADMAGQIGAELRHETAPPDALVLWPEADARAAVLAWLHAGGEPVQR
jgi:acyl-CoA reductase-like NAD-dependent aldehyde dehydrogenase